uniref:LigA n=1 Tax=Parastrongyloides trichosuri TaxID=131310 RepID=A0A0N4ZKY8_PARTI
MGEDVEAGAEQAVFSQGGDQGVLVHHAAAGDVDQDAVRAERRQNLGVDQLVSRRAARRRGRCRDRRRERPRPGVGCDRRWTRPRAPAAARWPRRCGPGRGRHSAGRWLDESGARVRPPPSARCAGAARPAAGPAGCSASGPGPDRPRPRSGRRAYWSRPRRASGRGPHPPRHSRRRGQRRASGSAGCRSGQPRPDCRRRRHRRSPPGPVRRSGRRSTSASPGQRPAAASAGCRAGPAPAGPGRSFLRRQEGREGDDGEGVADVRADAAGDGTGARPHRQAAPGLWSFGRRAHGGLHVVRGPGAGGPGHFGRVRHRTADPDLAERSPGAGRGHGPGPVADPLARAERRRAGRTSAGLLGRRGREQRVHSPEPQHGRRMGRQGRRHPCRDRRGGRPLHRTGPSGRSRQRHGRGAGLLSPRRRGLRRGDPSLRARRRQGDRVHQSRRLRLGDLHRPVERVRAHRSRHHHGRRLDPGCADGGPLSGVRRALRHQPLPGPRGRQGLQPPPGGLFAWLRLGARHLRSAGAGLRYRQTVPRRLGRRAGLRQGGAGADALEQDHADR